jgi:hypothetical protein
MLGLELADIYRKEKVRMKTIKNFRRLTVILMLSLAVTAALSAAIAQSRGGFSLNSPASFPVDI